MTRYDPKSGIEDQAAAALIDVIALYKAAGYSESTLESAVSTFWAMTKPATPKEPTP